MIPSAAAEEIKKKATGDYVKASRVAELARGKGLDIAAELSALAEVCEKGAGEFIRMGSAGIDNYETAWGLLIKDGLALILRDLDQLIPEIGELREPFGEHQVASTASPHKRNPYGCNTLNGLAELVRGNAATMLR